MNGRKSVFGMAVLCALVFGAFATASASAAEIDETAYTCTASAPELKFKDEHCLDGTGTATRGHKLIAVGVTTEITGSNEKTAEETKTAEVSKLKGALSGVVTEVQCTGLHGIGSLKNEENGAGDTWVSGGGTINYSGCTVTQPAGKGCVVTSGKITTNPLTATTKGQAAKKLQFLPPSEGAEKNIFAKITISGCSIGSLNNTFPVTGSVIASTNGATTTSTHTNTTEQNTLKFGGVKAGIEGALTISMNKHTVGPPTTNTPEDPIVLT